jgi:hypothetical protein
MPQSTINGPAWLDCSMLLLRLFTRA